MLDFYNSVMTDISTITRIDPDMAWAAFERRDRDHDGLFVAAVRSTGIYCKPSCPARHPRRENVQFFEDGAAARAAGFRACMRCRPDEVARDRQAVERAIALMQGTEDLVNLDRLAAHAGYAAHHFHRLFKRATGVTPAAYARKLRADRLETALLDQRRVTDAIYDAGYNAPSRAYADVAQRMGMTPSAWKSGGQGVVIWWTVAQSSFGPMLIAATQKGLCRVSFDEGEAELHRRFPKAALRPGDAAFADLAVRVVALVDRPGKVDDLPLDVRGTAFQQAVWEALRAIPPGETRSYAQIAVAAGHPGAVRAAGTACGSNQLAVVIPCHRVVRGDGGLGGYAYGTARKDALLSKERSQGDGSTVR